MSADARHGEARAQDGHLSNGPEARAHNVRRVLRRVHQRRQVPRARGRRPVLRRQGA